MRRILARLRVKLQMVHDHRKIYMAGVADRLLRRRQQGASNTAPSHREGGMQRVPPDPWIVNGIDLVHPGRLDAGRVPDRVLIEDAVGGRETDEFTQLSVGAGPRIPLKTAYHKIAITQVTVACDKLRGGGIVRMVQVADASAYPQIDRPEYCRCLRIDQGRVGVGRRVEDPAHRRHSWEELGRAPNDHLQVAARSIGIAITDAHSDS